MLYFWLSIASLVAVVAIGIAASEYGRIRIGAVDRPLTEQPRPFGRGRR